MSDTESTDQSTDSSVPVSTELSRNLGLLEVAMIGIGAMIGAGVFALTGFAAGLAGPALMIAFLLNGIIAALTAMSYAELGASFPEAGGAYSWVSEALPSPYGFYTGWANWFAQAVACALYAVTFGTFFIALITQYSSLTEDFVLFGFLTPIIAEKAFAAIVVGLFAYINYRGAEETGAAGIIVTSIKIVILAVFVVFGVIATFDNPNWSSNFVSSPSFAPNGIPGILGAMGFVYVAFEGYDIIVQSGEEIKDPGRNIPRAIFYSLLVAIPIYILVAFSAIGGIDVTQNLLDLAGVQGNPASVPTWEILGDLGELGIIRAASQFVPFGFLLLIIAGLAATVSALNATLFASSRIAFSMSRDHLLPSGLSEISSETRSPYQSIAVSAVLIALMAVALPIESVASSSSIMFILLFSMVNVAAIAMRRNRPDLERPFKIPYMPTIPILGIVFQLVLAPFLLVEQGLNIGFGESSQGFIALVTMIIWFVIGIGVYQGYSSKREAQKLEDETPTVVSEQAKEVRESQLVVPIANPESIEQLLDTAIDIARDRDAELHIVNVVTVPPQTPLDEGRQYVDDHQEIINQALKIADDAGIPAHGTIRIGHDPSEAILNTVEQHDSEGILMGWSGPQRRRDAVLGSNIDRVATEADCDVLVQRIGSDDDIESILLPTAGGPHAEYAAEIAGAIGRSHEIPVELVYVLDPEADEDDRSRANDVLNSAVESIGEYDQVNQNIITGDSIVSALVAETEEHDLTIIGSTREGLLQQLIFGTIPEELARRAEGTVIMAKRNLPFTSLLSSWIDSN